MVHFIFQSSCIFDIWLTFWGRSNPFYWRKLSQWQLLQSASQSSPRSVFVMGWGLGLESWKELRSGEWQDRFHRESFFSLGPVLKIQISAPESASHQPECNTPPDPAQLNKEKEGTKKGMRISPKVLIQLGMPGSSASWHTANPGDLNREKTRTIPKTMAFRRRNLTEFQASAQVGWQAKVPSIRN